jgi:putative glutathione S-transferase
MGLLVKCEWRDQWYDTKQSGGAFVRQERDLRQRIARDGNSAFQAARERYHLHASLACPWAHRTLTFRKLKELDHVVDKTLNLTGIVPLGPVPDWAAPHGRGWGSR